MKVRCVACVILAVAAGAFAAGYQALNVAGCFKLAVPGNRRQLMALPLTKPAVCRGVISDSDDATITDSSANWTAGQYAWSVTGAEPTGGSAFFLEVTQSNSVFVGRRFYVTNNTATVLTIKDGLPPDVAATNMAGCAYKIIPAWRIRDVFGEPGSPRLQGGSSITDSNADLITFGMRTAAIKSWYWLTPIHYHTGDSPTNLIGHWVQFDQNVDDLPIDRDESFLVSRHCLADTNLVVSGEVSPNAQALFSGGSEAYLAGGMSMVNVMFKDSNLTNAAGFRGGAGSTDTNAVTIEGWNPSTNYDWGAWDSLVYFNSSASTSLGGHWVKLGSKADSNYLNAGSGYLLVAPHGLDWKRASPLPHGVAP